MKKSDIFWQTYLNLEKEAIEVSKYIFFTDEVLINNSSQHCKTQLETFSPHIADLLVQCCVQIEAISKELYFDNCGNKARGNNKIFFDEDCLKLIDIKWESHNKIVNVTAPFFNFTKDENRILRPLKDAHKKQGNYWEKAYQAIKHDRYSSLRFGNVKAFIRALAALYLLNLYYRNDSWITKYYDISKLDYSMGSRIFSVNPPVVKELWYKNTPIISESPYVVSYKDNDYRQLQKMQQYDNQKLYNYLIKQPELKETAFQEQLAKANNSAQGITYIWELVKYRLEKKFPNTLNFDERKYNLINSDEWNCQTFKDNLRYTENDIKEDNIQNIIEFVAQCYGLEMANNLQIFEWITTAINSEICKIYIPE